MIGVVSGKGGVGKSVIAANLAMLLAKRGKRVVLADLDVGGADAHILFGLLNPPRTLTDFVERRVERLEEVLQPISAHPFLQLLPGTGDTLATANLLEYGSEKQPAEPWLRPAFASSAPQAIQTIEKELLSAIQRVVRKLARQNGAR